MTITHQLITALKLIGANEFAHSMHRAETATKSFARATKDAGIGGGGIGAGGGGAGGLGGLGRGIAALGGGGGGVGGGGALAGLGGLVTGGAVLGALGFLAAESVKSFNETEKAIFGTTLVLKNLGSSLPIKEVQAFAAEQQKLTGVNSSQIVSTVGLLERYGVTDSQVKGLTRTVQDFAAGAQIPLEDATIAVGEALVGNTGRLKTLGVTFKSTGDKARDLATLQKELSGLFGGGAEARLNTVAGSFEALGSALSNLLSAVGSRLSTVLVPVVQALTSLVNFLAENVILFTTGIGALAGFLLGGPVGALIGAIAGFGLGLLPEKGNAAEGIGGKSKLATEDTLQKIEQNTSRIDDLVKSVFGEAGAAARTGFTLRDARLAFGI